MQRVLVMGCSGSGKTTFGMALARKLNVPFVSLDQLFWLPGWREPDKIVFSETVRHAAEQPCWVMDGNYISHAGELRRERADTIVWFDLPRRMCLTGVLGRIVRSYGRVRPEMAPGCPEQVDLKFLRYVWTFREQQRSRLLTYFSALRPDQRFITFTSRPAAHAFLAEVVPA